jgi:hypothetical protein
LDLILESLVVLQSRAYFIQLLDTLAFVTELHALVASLPSALIDVNRWWWSTGAARVGVIRVYRYGNGDNDRCNRGNESSARYFKAF